MDIEHEEKVGNLFKECGIGKTDKKAGYYADKDLERQHLKEIASFKANNVGISYSPMGVVDVLRLIANIMPKIKNPKHKIVIEKYLMGYSIREICQIVGYSAPSTVHELIGKYKPIITEEYEEEKAIIELFEGPNYIYHEPDSTKLPIERDVSDARLLLESMFGFETYIYPFDITPEAYKITIKHPDYGTHKLSCQGLVSFADKIKKGFRDG